MSLVSDGFGPQNIDDFKIELVPRNSTTAWKLEYNLNGKTYNIFYIPPEGENLPVSEIRKIMMDRLESIKAVVTPCIFTDDVKTLRLEPTKDGYNLSAKFKGESKFENYKEKIEAKLENLNKAVAGTDEPHVKSELEKAIKQLNEVSNINRIAIAKLLPFSQPKPEPVEVEKNADATKVELPASEIPDDTNASKVEPPPSEKTAKSHYDELPKPDNEPAPKKTSTSHYANLPEWKEPPVDRQPLLEVLKYISFDDCRTTILDELNRLNDDDIRAFLEIIEPMSFPSELIKNFFIGVKSEEKREVGEALACLFKEREEHSGGIAIYLMKKVINLPPGAREGICIAANAIIDKGNIGLESAFELSNHMDKMRPFSKANNLRLIRNICRPLLDKMTESPNKELLLKTMCSIDDKFRWKIIELVTHLVETNNGEQKVLEILDYFKSFQETLIAPALFDIIARSYAELANNTTAIDILNKRFVQFIELHSERKMLAHLLTISGDSDFGDFSFELEGYTNLQVLSHLEKEINEFYGISSKVSKILVSSDDHDNIEGRINQNGLVALYGALSNKPHAIGAVIFKDGENYILARCNKGGQGPVDGIQFDKVGDPSKLQEWAKKFNEISEDEFLKADILQLQPYEFKPILQKRQKVGNCTIANFNSMERAVLYAISRQEGLNDSQARKISKARHDKRSHDSAMKHLENYLKRYENGANRETIDLKFIAKLFLKHSKKSEGLHESERLARLFRWLLHSKLPTDDFVSSIKAALKEVDDFTIAEDVSVALLETLLIINRNKQDTANEFLNKFIDDLAQKKKRTTPELLMGLKAILETEAA